MCFEVRAQNSCAAALDPSGEHAIAVATDVTVRSDLDALAQAALERWGRIDILAANAGIYPQIALVDLDQQSFDRLIAINVRGAIFATQACIGPMGRRGYGRIVLVSSIAGRTTKPTCWESFESSRDAFSSTWLASGLRRPD